jgi:hypothetical protein
MNFDSLVPDDDYLENLGSGVWLMDDHRWALIAWERCRIAGQRYALMHADYHWDDVDDLADSPTRVPAFLAAQLPELIALTKANKLVRFDSFIAAAVRRGLVAEVHFFCTEDEATDEGLDQKLCEENQTLQFIHPDASSFAGAAPSSPIIFDLCLDLFNNESDGYEEGDLWPDEDVLGFIEAVAHHIKAAALVTVSMSFGYSGSEGDTRHLAKLVVPRILEMRSGGNLSYFGR